MYSFLSECKGPKGQTVFGMSTEITNDRPHIRDPGKAYYYMMHWNRKKNNLQVGDWKSTTTLSLHEDTVYCIDYFARSIITALGVWTNNATVNWYPGIVYTVKGYQQMPHVNIPYEYDLFESNSIDKSSLS